MIPARPWMDEATEMFLRGVDALDDEAWERETLPGWRPREIVAHVHHNAEAISNLATWASTGVETPMYPSMEQRDEDIRASALLPISELRRMVRHSAERLAGELDELTDEAWQRTVVTAQGRTVPASEVVWMRTREVAVHGVDLQCGIRFEDFSNELLAALVDDVVKLRVRRGEAATLAAWLTGRATGGELGPWI